ncbi:MAG: hypothetical protein JNM07_01525 [Phycisphaerae bacterium]|nr:hypothetical protein [Phycisphaerae bacterium]
MIQRLLYRRLSSGTVAFRAVSGLSALEAGRETSRCVISTGVVGHPGKTTVKEFASPRRAYDAARNAILQAEERGFTRDRRWARDTLAVRTDISDSAEGNRALVTAMVWRSGIVSALLECGVGHHWNARYASGITFDYLYAPDISQMLPPVQTVLRAPSARASTSVLAYRRYRSRHWTFVQPADYAGDWKPTM